jgi:hypothetical protein
MYCPEGYNSFAYVLDRCDTLAGEYWSAHINHRIAHDAKTAFFERDLLVCWMILRAFLFYQFYICSPRGEIFKANGLLLFHEDRIGWYDWSWPAIENHELQFPLQRAIETNHSGRHFDRFRFIDFATGTICVRKREHLIRQYAHEADEDIEHQLFVASQFEGWAICVREDDFPATDDEFLLDIGLEGERFTLAEPERRRGSSGRPRLQDRARSAYRALFPQGHGAVPWKVVESQVSDFAGRSISAKTIQRAIEGADKSD